MSFKSRYGFPKSQQIAFLVSSLFFIIIIALFRVSSGTVSASGFNVLSPVQSSSAPVLLTQENSNRAIAFDSVTLLAEPFQPQAAVKFSDDGRTRIMLFTTNLILLPGEDASSVTAQAEDGEHRIYNLPVEAVCDVPGFDSFRTVIFKVDDNLTDVGDVLVGIKLHDQSSNRVRIGIGHVGGGPADDNPVPTPSATPLKPVLVAETSSVQTGGGIPVSLSGTWRSTGDYVVLYKAGATNAQYLDVQVAAASMTFTAPTTEGSYNFRYIALDTSSGSYYVAATSNIVTVLSSQPTPTPTPTSTPAATPTPTQVAPILVAQLSSVQTGSGIPVSLSGIWRPTGDYVGLYKADTTNAQYLEVEVAAANMTFTAPTTEGSYNFRYIALDTSSGNYYVAATSNIVTVLSSQPTPTPTAIPTPTPTSTPTATPTPTQLAPILVAQLSSVQTGGGIPVALSGVWRPTGDYVGLYKVDTTNAQYLEVEDAAASMTFTAPTTEGSYNFRYIALDTSSGNYYVAATSNIVTVWSSQPTPTPTATPTPAPTATPTPTPAPTATPTPVPPSQCTWIISPGGSSAGDGSISRPWSLRTVFGGDPGFDGVAPPAAIRPGDTVCLRGGTYQGFFRTILAGTPAQLITVQAYPGERATIDSASLAGGTVETNDTVIIDGGYLILRDIEITNSYASDRTNARPGGISVNAPGIKIINNIIHDTGGGISSSDTAYDCEFYGNVIYNNGWDDTNTGLHQGGTGHGIYVQNQQGFKRLYENIITGSFGYGLHAYVAGAHLINLDVQGSVSFDNGYWTRGGAGPYCSTTGYGCEGGGTVNFFFGAGHIPVTNLTLLNNYGFHRENRSATNLQLGYGGGENLSVTAQNNTLIGGDNLLFKFENVNFTNNVLASSVQSLNWVTPDTYDPSQQLIDRNTYYFYPLNCASAEFDGTFGFQSVTQWQANGFDRNSTFYACGIRPGGFQVLVRPNAYDANRAHLIIYNNIGAASVSANLSSFLTIGTNFEIRNAENYYGTPIVSGTYTGALVSIPMSSLTVATPVGWTGAIPPSSGPKFGALILIKK